MKHSHCYVVCYRFPSGKIHVDPHHSLFCLYLPHPHMAATHEQAQVREWSQVHYVVCLAVVCFSGLQKVHSVI